MALWSIAQRNEMVKLSFIKNPLDIDPVIEDCGKGDQVLLGEVTRFVFESVEPLDMVRMPDGAMFVRQAREGCA